MRTSHTVVVERQRTFTSSFDTEPYEAGWASEARWFVRLSELAGEGATLVCATQVSPDGQAWCDDGSAALVLDAPGLYTCVQREFGQWLRLRCELRGAGANVTVMVSLALKE
jgi:hypothetical protein